MIANLTSFDCWANSPCQYQRKFIEKSIKNIDTDASMKRVNYIPTDRYPWKEYFLNLWYSIVYNLI